MRFGINRVTKIVYKRIVKEDWFSVFIDAYHARLRAQDNHVV